MLMGVTKLKMIYICIIFRLVEHFYFDECWIGIRLKNIAYINDSSAYNNAFLFLFKDIGVHGWSLYCPCIQDYGRRWSS